MKLPTDAVRAAMKLENSAQRLFWAVNTLQGALVTSPAGAANIPYGVPATTANTGVITSAAPGKPPYIIPWFVEDFWDGGYEKPHHYIYSDILLPYDPSLYARGLPIEKCIIEVCKDIAEPIIPSLIPSSGTPILDNSKCTTVEQYIYEQWALLKADRLASPVTLPVGAVALNGHTEFWQELAGHKVNYNEWDYMRSNYVVLNFSILKKPTSSIFGDDWFDVNLGGKPRVLSPYEVTDFATYNSLLVV
jgi:hypothetical protein